MVFPCRVLGCNLSVPNIQRLLSIFCILFLYPLLSPILYPYIPPFLSFLALFAPFFSLEP